MQKQNVVRENKMGTMPVGKLLLSMALPMMASMLIQALYNIVDSIYVAKLSQDAFNAVSLSFPIQNLMISIASGTGVGVNALLSKSLGEKNFERANKFAVNGIFLAVVSYVLVLIFGLTCVRPFFESQTPIKGIVDAGVDYLTICSVFSFGIFGQIIFERLLQSTGKSIFSMFTQMFGAVINIVLDPVFIFGYWGLPAMGAAGAAIATVIGQICSCGLGLIFNLFINKDIKISLRHFRPDFKIIGNIYKIGLPSIIMMSIGSITTYCLNVLLMSLEATGTATAVYGAYFKLQSFVFMPVFGLNNGMVPIIGYNLGAGNRLRLIKTYKLSVLFALVMLLIGMALMLFAPDMLLGFFEPSEYMLELGRPALRTICFSFPFAAFGIITGSLFQSCGKSLISMFMSIARQLVVLVPAAYLFGYLIGLDWVWLSFPVAELASSAVAIFGLISLNKKIISKLPDGAPVGGIKAIKA